MLISLLTFISPILGIILILTLIIKNWRKSNNYNLKKLAIPFGLLFGMFGYSMTFHQTSNDLLSYFNQVDAMTNYSLHNVISMDIDNLYVRDVLFYFVNRCANYHILPFLVGFTIYSIVFYVLFDIVSRSSRNFKTSEIVLLALISTSILSPYSIIGNTRCILSYVLVSFAVYRELVQNKKNLLTYLLYILPLGLHTSAIIIILIRILSTILKKIKKIAIIIVIAVPTIIDIAHQYVSKLNFGFLGNLLVNAVNKSYSYLHWTTGGWASEVDNSISSKLVKIFGTIFIVLMLMIIFKNNEDKEKKLYDKPMISYLYYISLFTLGCLSIKTGAFWRFEAIVVLFSPVILVQAIEIYDKRKIHFNIISIFSVILLIYNIAYQIRNLDASNTLINFLTTSGLQILSEIIRGLINIF